MHISNFVEYKYFSDHHLLFRTHGNVIKDVTNLVYFIAFHLGYIKFCFYSNIMVHLFWKWVISPSSALQSFMKLASSRSCGCPGLQVMGHKPILGVTITYEVSKS